MLQDVAAASEAGLRALGFRVGERAGDTWSLVLPNSRPAVRMLRGDRGRITLSEARKRGDLQGGQRVLLVAPSASPGVLDAARLGRWDLLLWEAPLALINGVPYEAIGSGGPADAPRRRDRIGQPAPLTQPAPLPPGLLERLPTPAIGGSLETPVRAVGGPATGGSPGGADSAGGDHPGGLAGNAGRRDGVGRVGGVGDAGGPAGVVPSPLRPAPVPPPHTGGRPAWTRWAVARLLLLQGSAPVARLSDVLGVSRQAVSRALTQWGELVARRGDGAWAPRDAPTLLAAWEAAYPGPGGTPQGWWHPLPPLGQTRAAALLAQRAGASPVVAGAVAAQVHDPAREARLVRLLLRTDVDLRPAGFERVGLERATLTTLVPRDPTVWATAVPAAVAGQPVVIVDRLLAAHGPDAGDQA